MYTETVCNWAIEGKKLFCLMQCHRRPEINTSI